MPRLLLFAIFCSLPQFQYIFPLTDAALWVISTPINQDAAISDRGVYLFAQRQEKGKKQA